MHRHRSLTIVAAIASLALTAGIATAHVMPTASDQGLATAGAASTRNVPMGVDGSFTDSTPSQNGDTTSAPTDTHGYTVSQAAQNPTPTDVSWANHGAYVSSIAKGWGQQTAATNRKAASTPADPSAATDGPSHRP